MLSTRYGVLHVEDNPGDAELVSERLAANPAADFDVFRVATLREAKVTLKAKPADAVLLDLNLSDSQGLQTLAVLRAVSGEVPIIVLTGLLDESLRSRAMAIGAEDVLAKHEANTVLFPRAILYVIQRMRARQHHRKVERMLDSMPDAILVVDVPGVVRYVNRAATRLFGREPEEFVGERLGFSIADDQPSEIVITRRGDFRVCEIRVVSFEWEGQAAFLATLRDVTDARASERRFRKLAESGIIGVVTADLTGGVVDANDVFLQTLGYTRDELVQGKLRWDERIPADGAAAAAGVVDRLRSSGAASAFEIELLRKDGARVPLLIGAALLEFPRCIAFTIDLTDRRRADAARHRAEEALHNTEEQLRHAQKMDAVGRLAGGIAHDFNNILAVILSYGELIRSSLRQDDPIYHDVLEIEKAGERGARLIRQLLLFSRQQVIQPQVLDLNETLLGMKNMLERLLGADVEFVVSPSAALGRVRMDPGSVEQVIMNLVVNARDAMPTGGQLTIETADVELGDDYARQHMGVAPGAFVMLAVSDTGIGMDKATQRRIFEPFFTTKGPGKGTGLGLSTVFGIVRQSGGTIWVYSEPGRGTTFKVYLPRTAARTIEVHQRVASTKLRGSETVLLVEDEDQVRAVAASILRRFGYSVIEARNAGEALLVSERYPNEIQLLLSDVVMPQMSGPELALRVAEARPTMKILCMSGYTDDSIVRHGVLATEVAFLQKPFTPEALAKKVREVLDGGLLVDELARE